MKKPRALITGIAGQDGSYLAELLLREGFEVFGIERRATLEATHNFWRVAHIQSQIEVHAGSVDSFPSIYSILKKVVPDYCFHFAAQSFVSYSFEDEFATMNVNVNGTHYLLSAIAQVCPDCRLYFAGSSEMFGKVDSSPQTEETRFRPRSVYGISKLVGHELVRNYRESNKLFACTGILYNHESPRRGLEFVTRKITSTAAQIKLGLAHELRLGNIDAKRDWGFAGDYVEAIYAMLMQPTPEDFVIGTGEIHSVRNFLEIAFGELGLNYLDYIIIDQKFFRPAEEHLLIADPNKAKSKLGWRPKVAFEDLVRMMIRADYDYYMKKR
ncbi:MAG: GDP-mannose 4,6-dehydratase [Oligoflexia bacterium]|nr:GDP-mannose 4,6-dehydratase [Oligoflexia bacterium]